MQGPLLHDPEVALVDSLGVVAGLEAANDLAHDLLVLLDKLQVDNDIVHVVLAIVGLLHHLSLLRRVAKPRLAPSLKPSDIKAPVVHLALLNLGIPHLPGLGLAHGLHRRLPFLGRGAGHWSGVVELLGHEAALLQV